MLIAFVAFASTLMAGGNLKVNILPLTSEKAVVAISNTDAANFKISIKNDVGETVYYKETEADSKDYRKVFDFSDLEQGNYKLSVTVNGLTTEREFTIDKRNIAVGNEKSLLEPYFGYKDGVLTVSYLNFPEERMSLNFYNGQDLVYSKKLGNKFNVIEGYNLSKLEKGRYSVVLATESKNYSYDVDIK
jgi:hypothetical protein